jgi:cyclophilin family peptidyl-prolyl cis-trans isomerase
VANFVSLTQKGYYNGLTFHRVVPDFVIQGGDPKGDGTGGPGYTIPDEVNGLSHNVGTVAMAKTSAPNSAGSQFYIVIGKPAPFLDANYTVFGQVIEGQAVAEKIQIGDKITEASITEPAATAPVTPATPNSTGQNANAQTPPKRTDGPAELVERYYPEIPKSLWTAKYKRTLRAKVEIAPNGFAKPTLTKNSGNKEIDQTVLDALKKWKWQPAIQNGVPVASVREFDIKLGQDPK